MVTVLVRRASVLLMPIALMLLLIALPALSQTTKKRAPVHRQTASTPSSWPLVSLNIKGNKLYSDAQISAAAGLKIGQTVSKASFEAAREKLIATGVFDVVGYNFAPSADGAGYAGTFEVSEIEQVFPVRFEDLLVPDVQLIEYIKQRQPLLGARIPGTEQILKRVAADLQEYLSPKGLKDKVIGRVVSDTPGEMNILFRPSTPPPSVAEVRFTGMEAVPSPLLHNTFAGVAVGVPYREKTIRQLLDTSIRRLYETRGRLRVSFPSVQVKKAENVDGVSLAIQVDEGPSFSFGEIRASGSELPPKETIAAAALKPGDLANFDAVQSAVDRIQKRYRAAGYMRAQTRFEREIRDKSKTVDIVFITEAGPKFAMGKLKMEGLDIVTDPVMRKLWTMTEGKPYNADYPQLFLDRVKEEGYFDNLLATSFSQQVNERNNTVDVTLKFKFGAPPKQPDPNKPPSQ